MMAVVGWLLVSRNSKPHLALPVPRQALMGLTRAVSFSLQTISEEQSLLQQDRRTSGSWRDKCWLLAAADPAVAIWLISEEKQPWSEDGAGVHRTAGADTKECSAGQAASQWLDRLEESLVTFSTTQGLPALKQADSVSVQELYAIAGMALSDVDARGERTAETRSRAGRWLGQLLRETSPQEADRKVVSQQEIATILALGDGDPQVAMLHELLVTAKSLRGLFNDFAGSVSSARLEAIRELAYGAGHEINNPLANIAARAQALLYDEHEPERQRRLATIVDQAFRARDMIGGLMIFARPPKPNRIEVNLEELLRSVLASVEVAAEERGVRLVLDIPSNQEHVFVDRGQIEDSLRGIVSNAIEAIHHGGTVSIEAVRSEHGSCLLNIRDNGIGMDRDTMARMFDPFFSGREAGRGIGLGLSKALRLIDGNGGSISIESRLQQGTTVSVRLQGCKVNASPPV
jgi:signal transduction histidine kinase